MPRIATWAGTTFKISAYAVPRYLWQTASIDVTLDGKDVLKTGGVLKFVGRHAARYTYQGEEHLASLTWGIAWLNFIPVQLAINGSVVFKGRVRIQGWWRGLLPWALLSAVIVWKFAR